MKQTLLLSCWILLLFSCSVTHKLTTAKTLRIIDRSVYSVDTIPEPKYILYTSFNTYKTEFFEELKAAFKENNVIVVDTGTQLSDYTLIVNQLVYKERIELETVRDSASSDNGRAFPLRVCSITSESVLYNSKVEKVDDLSVNNFSTETLTNTRTFWDYLFHTNKEFHDYHVKTIASGIFEYIAKGSGKSLARNGTNKIFEAEKKSKSF